MKNRLMLLALAMFCYGHMQAAGFFTDQLNRVKSNIRNNYYLQPYFDSLGKIPLQQRIAPYTRSITQKLASYKNYLENLEGYNYSHYSKDSFGKLSPQDAARRIHAMRFLYGPENPEELESMTQLENHLNLDYSLGKLSRDQGSLLFGYPGAVANKLRLEKNLPEEIKEQKIFQARDDLLKQLGQEAQISSFPNWLQRQRRIQHHPDYFEY